MTILDNMTLIRNYKSVKKCLVEIVSYTNIKSFTVLMPGMSC